MQKLLRKRVRVEIVSYLSHPSLLMLFASRTKVLGGLGLRGVDARCRAVLVCVRNYGSAPQECVE